MGVVIGDVGVVIGGAVWLDPPPSRHSASSSGDRSISTHSDGAVGVGVGVGVGDGVDSDGRVGDWDGDGVGDDSGESGWAPSDVDGSLGLGDDGDVALTPG